MRLGKSLGKSLIIVSGLCLSLPASAAVLDDFNTYTAGQVATGATGTTWTMLGNADGGVIQNEAGNLLLTAGASAVGANVNVYRPLNTPIAAADTATTVFMRVRANISTGLNGSFGLTDVAPALGSDVAQFETQFRLITTAGVSAIEGRNGGAFQTIMSPITTSQWYNVWMVVNNSTDTWDAYVNTGTANATAGDLKLSGIGFRNGAAANPLTHFDVFGGAGGILGESIDDIYVNSGVVLTNFTSTPLVLGDTDGDGVVELSDFNPIRDNFQKTVSLRSQGDLNRDGTVEFADFREWKHAFLGTGSGASLQGLDLSFLGGNVPEPSSVCMLLMAATGLVLFIRRRGAV